MYDYLTAPLHCSNCSAVSPATAITNMQTCIRSDANGSELRVGSSLDRTDLTIRHLVGADYKLVAPPSTGETIRLLDAWTCPSCKTEQWAIVEIAENRIERIEAVVLNRSTFQAVNFVAGSYAELLPEAFTTGGSEGSTVLFAHG